MIRYIDETFKMLTVASTVGSKLSAPVQNIRTIESLHLQFDIYVLENFSLPLCNFFFSYLLEIQYLTSF